MKASLLMRTLLVMLALEWELGGEDPVIFCYRISVRLRTSSSEGSTAAGNSFSGAA
jgi:hypothetical protein